MSELVLSSSSAQAYLACPYRFYLQYVEMHEGVQSMQSAVGVAVHAGAEHFYREYLDTEREGEIPVEEVLEVADLAYMLEIEGIVDGDEDLMKMRPVVGRVMVVYLEDVATQIVDQVRGVEHEGRAVIDGIDYSGHLDVVTDAVRDTKVLKSKPRYPEKYLFQLTGYDLILEATTGDRGADRILDIIIRLVRDRPRYDPISYGESTYRQIEDFRRKLHHVANGIAQLKFPPEGLATGECKYCPVRYECEPYQKSQEA